jgi:hypothetical protein
MGRVSLILLDLEGWGGVNFGWTTNFTGYAIPYPLVF